MKAVIKQEPCPTCKGYTMVFNPFYERGNDVSPPEEILCPECDGAGSLRREVEITEALSFVDDRLYNLEQQVNLITNIVNIGFVEVTK